MRKLATNPAMKPTIAAIHVTARVTPILRPFGTYARHYVVVDRAPCLAPVLRNDAWRFRCGDFRRFGKSCTCHLSERRT